MLFHAAWEVYPTAPQDYWRDMPVKLHDKIHWYNIPAPTNAGDYSNPWNIIRRIYRPGDMVVVKLVRCTQHTPAENFGHLGGGVLLAACDMGCRHVEVHYVDF